VGADQIVASSQIVSALQTIASRHVNPMEQIVVSVTQIHGGDTWNVIPGEVQLRGTVRTFLPTVQTLAEQRMKAIVNGIATAMGCSADVDYQRRYPATINTPKESERRMWICRQFHVWVPKISHSCFRSVRGVTFGPEMARALMAEFFTTVATTLTMICCPLGPATGLD
jgi:acetylornithine deacetylase/succinyl-diaminopimelate desuccinylase-like protein